jgi:hypothetical protein
MELELVAFAAVRIYGVGRFFFAFSALDFLSARVL